MHDIRTIRDDPNKFDAALKRRGAEAISSVILDIDLDRRAKITSAEAALAERNTASKMVGAAKASGDEMSLIDCEISFLKKKQKLHH